MPLPAKGSQPRLLDLLFKLIFGQVSSLSCFIMWLNDISAGQGNSKILEDGIRILIFGNS